MQIAADSCRVLVRESTCIDNLLYIGASVFHDHLYNITILRSGAFFCYEIHVLFEVRVERVGFQCS